MKRKHSKIDKLPSDIKEAVEQMILGDYTYRDVCDFVRDTANVTLSEAAVCRYAQGLNASVQEIRLASENMRALTEEMQKFPQLDTTEGIARLISHKVLQAVQQMDEIALKEADPLKLIEKATTLIRAVRLKNSTDIKTANLKNVAFESFKEDIFDTMAKENPELYRSLVQFINSKSQEEKCTLYIVSPARRWRSSGSLPKRTSRRMLHADWFRSATAAGGYSAKCCCSADMCSSTRS